MQDYECLIGAQIPCPSPYTRFLRLVYKLEKGDIKNSFSEREADIWNVFWTLYKFFKQNFYLLKVINMEKACILCFCMKLLRKLFPLFTFLVTYA